jgi:hypothetical protein
MEFLGRPGDGGGRDREVAGQVAGALLELCAPFAVGGTGDGKGQLESLGLLAGPLVAGAFFGFCSADASAVGAGLLPGEVLSTERPKTSGVSESVDGASAARVSTVIVAAISS